MFLFKMLIPLLFLFAPALALSWAIPVAKGVSMDKGAAVNAVGGTYKETLLRSGPDSLARSGHYKDTLCITSSFTPSSGIGYVLAWDSTTGRTDTMSLGIIMTAYAADGRVIGRMVDSTIISSDPAQFRLPIREQLMGTRFSIKGILTPDASADSVPFIYHRWYIIAREIVK
jgi:hypothetical protein